jgi:IS5 family transposase
VGALGCQHRRGNRIDRPVEFGYKAQVTDNNDSIILDYTVEYSASGGPQLAPVGHVPPRGHRRPRLRPGRR